MGADNSLDEQMSSDARSQGGVGRESVLMVVKEIIEDILSSGRVSYSGKPPSVLKRSRDVVAKKAPRLKTAVKFTSSDLGIWMNRGGPWRASLVITTGIISLISLSGVFAFLLFLVTATVNAAIIALLGSVAAVGAIAALFFTALIAIYVSVLSVAAFIISTIAFLTIAAVVTATGWIGFWWITYLGVRKCIRVARGSLAFTAATIQSVSAGGRPPIIPVDKKVE